MNRVRRTSVLALIAGLSLVVFFAFKAWHQWSLNQRISSGVVQVESLRGWMTLPYIEKTYGVRQAEIRIALGLPESGFEERSLKDWLEIAQSWQFVAGFGALFCCVGSAITRDHAAFGSGLICAARCIALAFCWPNRYRCGYSG